MTGQLALVVVAATVLAGYGLITQSFAATNAGTPEIVSGLPGHCLDDFRNNAASGAKVDLWQCNGTAAQQWAMTNKTNGQIKIHDKCLDIYQGKLDGAKMELYACKPAGQNANQTWTYNAKHQLVSAQLRAPSNIIREMCLQPSGAANGSDITLQPCSPGNAPLQVWDFQNYVPTASNGGSGSGTGSGSGGSGSGGSGSGSTSGTPEVLSGYANSCLDDLRNSSANGSIVDIYTCNGTAAQQWTKTANTNAQIKIHGKCLDVFRNGTADGYVTDLYQCKPSGQNANQLWNITGGTIQAVGATTARKTRVCLNAPDPRNGTQLNIWKCDGRNSERWVFTSYTPNTAAPVSGSGTGSGSGSGSGTTTTTTTAPNVVTTGQPEIYSALKGYCLDDLKSGQANLNSVDIYKCNGTSAQQWSFSTQQLMIHGKCADVYRQGKTAGTIVDLYTCNGGANQKWDYVNNNFISHQSKLCLNAPGPRASGDPYNGLQLQIQTCDGRSSEKWYFGRYPQNVVTPATGSGTGTSNPGNNGAASTTGSATNEFPGVPQTPCDPATNPFCPPSSDSSGTPVTDSTGAPVNSTTVSQCQPVTNNPGGPRITAIYCQ